MNDYNRFDNIISGKPIRIFTAKGTYKDFSVEDLVGNRLNRFQGWLCSAGQNSLHIDMDGNIYPASDSCRRWKTFYDEDESQSCSFGNIYQGTYQFPENWLICDQPACDCGADLFIPKVKDIDYLPLLEEILRHEHKPFRQADNVSNGVIVSRCFHVNSKLILWDLHKRCNYDCIYCGQHNNTSSFLSLEQLKNISLTLKEDFLAGSRGFITISGGEPTLNPDYLEWLKYLKELEFLISTHSNGIQAPSVYQTIIQYCDLNMSVHFEYAKKDHLIEVVKAVIHTIKQNRANDLFAGNLEVKLMFIPGLAKEVLALREQLLTIEDVQTYSTLAIVPLVGNFIRKEFHLKGDIKEREMLPVLQREGEEITRFYTDAERKLFGMGY